jgi:glutamine synthetase
MGSAILGEAISAIRDWSVTEAKEPRGPRATDAFGSLVFNDTVQQARLPKPIYHALRRTVIQGEPLDLSAADVVAAAMMEWAVEHGATHYTHWFQPLTGITAEKHDSFLVPTGDGKAVTAFSGKELIQGEPDASSFPSGGMRSTFEARGYTAWDPSSPAFVTEVEKGKTLCIPSIFISYTGEALDKKLPLLRSDAALSNAAVELLTLFGHSAKRVFSTCGAEQEYFLIDEAYCKLRSDILLTGRTLFGAPSPKGQQLEDQYFGSIKERMLNFMFDTEEEAYKLGIPITTRHNEVAPHQYEFAPVFERSNLATDHNQLLMDLMKRVAKRHGLECLLYEKPFAGINGSGKHVNWSLSDDNGNNLLNPGETPEENLLFLTVLVAVINAVYQHADLLRASVATAGNEHRLGANEAPPAIVSVFLGEHLFNIVENIEKGVNKRISKKDIVDLGLSHLPRFTRDTTDRNRTSPFAFTGTKFEFRAVGSSANVSTPTTVLNTIIAESLHDMAERIRKATKGKDFTETVFKILAEDIKKSKPVLFEGDNYAAEWQKEAARRGLPNEPSTAKALKAFIDNKNIALFEKHKVFSKAELLARYNVWIDLYNKVIDIEGRTLLEMVGTQVLPPAYEFQNEIGQTLDMLKNIVMDETVAVPVEAVDDRRDMFANLTSDIYTIRKHLKELKQMLEKAKDLEEMERADFFFAEVKPHMQEIRRRVDDLETMMPDEKWSLPKYREMLFVA